MAIHLVRHGSAGSRPYAHGDDLERPLDERGLQQAKLLATHFADTPLRSVWSSTAVRCVDTVRPIAEAHGLEVEMMSELTEGADPVELMGRIRAEAHRAGDLVMCSHGDLIPEVVNAFLREGTSLVGSRGCEKGSIWTLETRGRDIVRAVHTAPARVSRPR